MKRSIEEQLVGIGNMIEAARRNSRSLSATERRIMERIQTKAIHEYGYSWSGINGLIMEGERGRRGSMPMPLSAVYIGTQEGAPFGLSFRMYNIEGDHEKNGSTVGVTDVLRCGIIPLDISLARTGYEFTKEQFLEAWYYIISAWERLTNLTRRT